MHKENCTVSFVMSGRGLNMSVVIYNSGLPHRAVRPRDPRVKRGLQEEWCDAEGGTK